MVVGHLSGTRSPTPRGARSTGTTGISPASTISASRRISTLSSSSGCVLTGSPSHGRGPAGRERPCQPSGPRFLPSPCGGLARAGRRARLHPLPLGPASDAGRPRRLDLAGHVGAFRGVRLDGGRCPFRRRRHVGHVERALVLGLARLRHRCPCARPYRRRDGAPCNSSSPAGSRKSYRSIAPGDKSAGRDNPQPRWEDTGQRP